MSSDDDVPAPSPSAAVLARRASREAKSMREESCAQGARARFMAGGLEPAAISLRCATVLRED